MEHPGMAEALQHRLDKDMNLSWNQIVSHG